jgi:predicted phosphodiesterase
MKFAIVSDIHSNWQALQAVMADMPEVDEVICLGDVVGYGGDPILCLDYVREKNWPTLVGNHDRACTDVDILEWFNEDAARAIESRFGVKVKGIVGADDASRASDVKDANIVFAAGAIGVHLLPESAWQNNPNIELLADANAQPPLGIEGIEATDKGKERHGKLCFGALGIGGLKLKLHRACIGKLFDSSERVLDAEEIYALAKEMA